MITAMERIVVTARLRPGSKPAAESLLAAGPPFHPGRLGLERHDVYLGEGIAVFSFEGSHVERIVSKLVNDPVHSAAFAAWAPLLEDGPQVAHEAYHWPSRRTP
jgi:hypothetical protein